MRQLILDTETTGLEFTDGHRITEIGVVEVLNQIPTGRTFHKYVNPEREVGEDSIRITGITNEKLAGMPLFSEVVEEFLDFVADDPIVAHNATFDINFLNHELGLCNRAPLSNEVVDTLEISRKKFPGARHSLDALCQRFEVDRSKRTLHGALLDAEILAEVYIELTGGRQTDLLASSAESKEAEEKDESAAVAQSIEREYQEPRPNLGMPTEEELANHNVFVEKIENSIWHSRVSEA